MDIFYSKRGQNGRDWTTCPPHLVHVVIERPLSRFALPGESAFPLSHFYGPAKSNGETEDLRKYLTQFRREIGFRLAEKVFDPELAPDGKPSKWWTCFSKRNFLKAPVIA